MKNPTPYYLWLNEAAALRRYWDADAQEWTADVLRATLFDTLDEACRQVNRAEDRKTGEAIIDRALCAVLRLTIPTANAVHAALTTALASPCMSKDGDARTALIALRAAIEASIAEARKS